MKRNKIIGLFLATMLVSGVFISGLQVCAEEAFLTVLPTYDTYIYNYGGTPDATNSKTIANGNKTFIFMSPVYGLFTEREDSPKSFGLLRFDLSDDSTKPNYISAADLKNVSSIKLRVTTLPSKSSIARDGNLGSSSRPITYVNEKPDDTGYISNPITPNGLDAANYTKITQLPMDNVLQVLGMQKGLEVDASGNVVMENGKEKEILYKTSWNETTTWANAGGLQVSTNGNFLRGAIVDSVAPKTTYEIDVTDYVVYSKLYDEDTTYRNVISFKLQEMMQNNLWRDNNHIDGFSIYSKESGPTLAGIYDAKNPYATPTTRDVRPALVFYKRTAQEAVDEIASRFELKTTAGDLSNVYTNLALPTSFEDTTITWESKYTALTSSGVVTLPESVDTNVILTATLSKSITENGSAKVYSTTKDFTVTVKSKEYVKSLLQALAQTMPFSKMSSEPQSYVTKNLNLQMSTNANFAISYLSSDENALKVNGNFGVVVRGKSDANVDLKANYFLVSDTAVKFEVVYPIVVKGTTYVPVGSGPSGGVPSVGAPQGGSPVIPPDNNNNSGNQSQYNDVSTDFWAKSYIDTLKEKRIMSGDENGNFRPEDNIKREEITKVIVSAFNLLQDNASSKFADVASDAWYVSYIASAAKLGIINGIGNGDFGVNQPVTRQDLAVMLYKTVKVTNVTLKDANIQNTTFADVDSIADYAKEAVSFLKQKGIINGYEGDVFKGSNTATRAEISKIIYTILNKINE